MDGNKNSNRILQQTNCEELHLPIGHYTLIKSNQNPDKDNHATKIAIHGLGSCVALILYDYINKISAMSHILLPYNSDKREGTPPKFPHKYAEFSVKELASEMLKKGAVKKNLKAAIIGGANIFKHNSIEMGKQNISAVKEQLDLLNIKIEKEIVGGTKGRVVIYDTINNIILVRITDQQEFEQFILR